MLEGSALIVLILLGGVVSLYFLKKLGDIKEIMFIILFAVLCIIAVYAIPSLQENPLFPAIDEFVKNLPQIMGEIWKKFTGGT